jgi:hypothetical protein
VVTNAPGPRDDSPTGPENPRGSSGPDAPAPPGGPQRSDAPSGITTPGGPQDPPRHPEPEAHPHVESQGSPEPTSDGEIHARTQTEQVNEELQEENAESALDQPSDGSGGE